MEVYRLSRKVFSNTLSGKGAALKGARWNSEGVEVIYTAMNRSLAMAEVAVHLSLAMLPADFMMLTIEIPDDMAILKLDVSRLPKNWNTFPYHPASQTIGDKFISENKYCLLHVPSAVTQGDYNLLINPKHKDFTRIKIVKRVKFPFDERIFQ
ncbi:RES superfamily protein [Chitinophaga caeni]|uniref:RES superfamily protein n=1 Tax=Chitinophaga caeni TaxID=2029983 RepID=A0A291QW97_9BACT|nr:RES family NAD+ phosphorylase [Chitinophaga caeni]ATL48309.1 RES superfamily protein [Chitinophaga caeni]